MIKNVPILAMRHRHRIWIFKGYSEKNSKIHVLVFFITICVYVLCLAGGGVDVGVEINAVQSRGWDGGRVGDVKLVTFPRNQSRGQIYEEKIIFWLGTKASDRLWDADRVVDLPK